MYVTINDTWQYSIAMCFGCGWTFDHYLIINLLLSLFWNNVWNPSTFGKVKGEKLIASSALCAGATCCWKMKNSLQIWRMAGRNCCNSIRLRLMLFTNPAFVIDKYRTGVMSIADSCRQWLNVNAQAFLTLRLSSGLMDMRSVGRSTAFSVWQLCLFVNA